MIVVFWLKIILIGCFLCCVLVFFRLKMLLLKLKEPILRVLMFCGKRPVFIAGSSCHGRKNGNLVSYIIDLKVSYLYFYIELKSGEDVRVFRNFRCIHARAQGVESDLASLSPLAER